MRTKITYRYILEQVISYVIVKCYKYWLFKLCGLSFRFAIAVQEW